MQKRLIFAGIVSLFIIALASTASAYQYDYYNDGYRSSYERHTYDAYGHRYEKKEVERDPWGERVNYVRYTDRDGYYPYNYRYGSGPSYYSYGSPSGRSYLGYGYGDSYRRGYYGSQYHDYYYKPYYTGSYWNNRCYDSYC